MRFCFSVLENEVTHILIDILKKTFNLREKQSRGETFSITFPCKYFRSKFLKDL